MRCKFSLGVVLALMVPLFFPTHSHAIEKQDIPSAADDQALYRFEILSGFSYTDDKGREVIDVIEGDQLNLALSADTKTGRPVIGLVPKFNMQGSSMLIPPGQSTSLTSTDESGIVEFGVIAGTKGLDEITVSFGKNTTRIYLNIISLRVKDFATKPAFDVDLNWTDLMQAKLGFEQEKFQVNFPDAVQSHNGEVVTIWGFMMPLNADVEQRHFLMTSSPPHCFFHIPGGAAGVVEVFSEKGILASWDPVLLRGTFRLIESTTTGLIYQIENAELIEP